MYIYGASGHARVIIDLIDDKETIHGIFDDNHEIREVLGYPSKGSIPQDFHFDHPFFIAIGDNRSREKIVRTYKLKPNSQR